MPVRNINGMMVEYRSEEWDGKDTSGIRVVGKCVLVLTDKAIRSAGGIDFTDQERERLDMACDTGVLVKVSPGAFLLNEDMTTWIGEKPKPGDHVYIEKYAGRQVSGLDGRLYRLMDYGAIGAVYELPAETAKIVKAA